MPEKNLRHTIDINAPARNVWKVLTDNQLIPQYMFGCIAETDWKSGSPLLWKGAADGKLYVKGKVVSFDAPRSLVYTIIDPNNPSIPDIPENYLTVTNTVSERGDASTLEMTLGDYSKVANGQQRYDESAKAGDFILHSIKKLAEAQPK